MLTLALFLLVGTTIFVPEEIPDLGAMPALPGDFGDGDDYAWQLPQADLDGDGTMDLLLSKGVIFFRNGHYTEPMPLPISAQDKPPVVQLWGRDLYLRFPDRLDVVTWENGGWQKKLTQPVEWPKPDPAFRADESEPEQDSDEPLRFGDFLHDIDGDGVPEIALALKDGIHCYARRGDGYEAIGVLNVYPSPRPERVWQPNWSLGTMRRMSGSVILRGAALTVLDVEDLPQWEVRIHITRYVLKMGDKEISAEKTRQSVTEPMPRHESTVQLNRDGLLDFVCSGRDSARSIPVGPAVSVIAASTDEGKTLQIRRTTEVPYNACSFFDMDGDGDKDMVVQRSGVFDGGFRELVTRFFTDTTVKHRLDMYLQDARGKFSTEPDRVWRGEIQLDSNLVHRSRMTEHYLEYGLVRFGDFNKDGRLDLAVQDRPDRISVYLAAADGFEAKPVATVATSAKAKFVVIDMDGDGRADIMVRERPGARVYFSREGQP